MTKFTKVKTNIKNMSRVGGKIMKIILIYKILYHHFHGTLNGFYGCDCFKCEK